MKILHIIPSISKYHGGPSEAVLLMGRALQERGHEVMIVTTDDDGPGKRLDLSRKQWTGDFGSTANDEFHGRTGQQLFFRKQTELYKVSLSLVRWVRDHAKEYDVVHSHAAFSHTSTFGARAAIQSGVPTILRPLGTLNAYGREKRHPWFKKIFLKLVDGPVLERCSAIHCTSESERSQAMATGLRLRCSVVPIGVTPPPSCDPDRIFELYPTLIGRTIGLFIGRIDPVKGLEPLLRQWMVVREAHRDAAMVIVGNGDPEYRDELQRKWGQNEGVFWTGALRGDDKWSALAAADFFVLPSYSENFGIAAAEALHAGKPCILGRGVAIAADIEAAGAGVAVNPESEELAKALSDCLQSKEKRARMGTAAMKLAQEKYSLQSLGDGLEALYKTVIK